MVMALGKLNEARRRGREEGREDMVRAMRELGKPETEIQQVLDWLDIHKNGERER